MEPRRASKTAEHNALFRALETRMPVAERCVDDPLAEVFLSRPYRAAVAAACTRAGRHIVLGTIDRTWPGVRTSVVARTRLIDHLIASTGAGVTQVVILGAGYDTRAWRLDCLRECDAIFEVDHPDTQRQKRALLDKHGSDSSRVRFVPTDFHLGRLANAMRDQGYDATAPALFLWEGTTNYLDPTSVDATLRWCGAAAPGSDLILTYINEDVLDDPSRYVGAKRVFKTLRHENERMTFGLDPMRLDGYLRERGLALKSDVGAAQFRQAAYGDAAHRMRGHEFYRVAHASVLASVAAC